MKICWIALSFAFLLLVSSVSSAPTTKDEKQVKSTNTVKSSTNEEEKEKKPSTPAISTELTHSEFKVPSSQLDNGDIVKSASVVKSVSLTKDHEAPKSEAEKMDKNEAKLLSILFDDKGKKSPNTKSSDKQKDKKKQAKGAPSKESKKGAEKKKKSQFSVMKLKKDLEIADHLGKYHQGTHLKHGFKDGKNKNKWLKWKGREYYDDDEDEEDEDGYGARNERRHRRPRRRTHHHGKRYRRGDDYETYDDDDDGDDDDGRMRSYSYSKSFKGKVDPEDVGFDKEKMEAIFGSAIRPGGFGTESMNHMTNARKMFGKGGFHGLY